MMATPINYFFMILCSIFVFKKLLLLTSGSWLKSFRAIVFSALAAVLVYVTRRMSSPLSMLVLLTTLTFYLALCFRMPFKLTVRAAVISVAICYALFVIAIILILPAVFFINMRLSLSEDIYSYEISIAGPLELCLAALLFRIKRLKSGMPFLREHWDSGLGVLMCASQLLVVSFFASDMAPNFYLLIPLGIIILLAFTLYFIWRSYLNRSYIEQKNLREYEDLSKTLEDMKKRIAELEKDNDGLAGIIHKDNKLIPAVLLSVNECVSTLGEETDRETIDSSLENLSAHLKELSAERSELLKDYESKNRTLLKTGLFRLDSVLSYMYDRAVSEGEKFEVTVAVDIEGLVSETVSEEDLTTAAADLISNAIIAVKNSSEKRILVNIGETEAGYAVNVFDSGEEFMAETLLSAGIKKASTHLDDGGSGIGMLSLFGLAEKYKASLEIEELNSDDGFTKKAALVFDGKKQYRVYTRRRDVAEKLSERPEIVVELRS